MRGNAGRSYLLLVARAVSLGPPAILFLPVGVLVQPVGDLIRNLRAPSKEGPRDELSHAAAGRFELLLDGA